MHRFVFGFEPFTVRPFVFAIGVDIDGDHIAAGFFTTSFFTTGFFAAGLFAAGFLATSLFWLSSSIFIGILFLITAATGRKKHGKNNQQAY
jgi:hypothetical protein